MNAMQPPQSVEEIKAGLETTEKGGVRQSIRNCLTVFQRDPLLSGAIAYNILTDRKDIIKPIGFHRESTALNDTDMKYLLLYLEETYGLTNEKKIDNAIGIVANENKYHPIRDYLSALVWDGTERIRFCLRHFLGADADDYTYEALKLFLLGAISRAFQPGCKFEIMLCLVGGQGAGKSTFFRLLAVRDEWFSDDLRKLDDDNVYRKLQGHWIIEMSEMMATANAKSIEEIKSFLSRQKEVYKIPYETHPADRPRQCVFGGTSNALDFLPLDRSGNRRFIPVMVYPEQAEVHILEDEAASRAYIEQMWAEAMEIYRSGRFKLAFSPAMQRYLKEHQRDFMPEDTKAGMIQAYLDKYTGSMVCSKQLYKEALNHAFDEPKQWEIREINEIMNQCISSWRYFPNPRMFSEYGRQKGWERENPATDSGNRRFIPVMVYPEQAEVHILEDEAASRAYIGQMWAEAMEIYKSGRFKLAFSPAMQRYLKEHQRDFMPEDTKAGMIQAYLDKYTGSMVCSKQLYKEALNHAFDEPKQWEIREINEIMNQCIDRWRYFPNPRMFSEYGRQKGWERENPATDSGNPSEKTMDGFVEVTEQMELPF